MEIPVKLNKKESKKLERLAVQEGLNIEEYIKNILNEKLASVDTASGMWKDMKGTADSIARKLRKSTGKRTHAKN